MGHIFQCLTLSGCLGGKGEAKLNQGFVLEKLLEGFSLICCGLSALGPLLHRADALCGCLGHENGDVLGMQEFPQLPVLGAWEWSWLCQHPAWSCPHSQGMQAAIHIIKCSFSATVAFSFAFRRSFVAGEVPVSPGSLIILRAPGEGVK